MSTKSAISSRPGAKTSILLALLLVSASPVALAAGQDLPSPKSLVKVFMVWQVPLTLQGKVVQGTRVHEVVALAGVVVDARGLVTAWVNDPWPLLDGKGVRFEVEIHDGRRFAAELVGVDERLQLAVLKVDELRKQSATLGPRPAKQAALSLLTVAQAGWNLDVVHVTSVRSVSSTPEEEIQVCGHAREIAKGLESCSGGLAWDDNGRLLGVVSGVDSGLSSGHKLALIPGPTIRKSVLRIAETGDNIRAGWLGISAVEREGGIWVKEVIHDSPAWEAGLMPGDMIIEVNGTAVSESPKVGSTIGWEGPGAEISVKVDRHGREVELKPRLSARAVSDTTYRYVIELGQQWDVEGEGQVLIYPEVKTGRPDPGFVTVPLTSQEARKLGAPNHGLLVREVIEGSLADRNGFEASDVLCDINGVPLKTSDDVGRLFASPRDGLIRIKYIRDRDVKIKQIRLH